MCALTVGSMIYGGVMAGISAIGSATASAGAAVGATMAAGATAAGVGAGAAATTGAVAAGLTAGALNGALIGTATGAIAGAATGKGAGRGALLGAATGAAGGALLSGAGMAVHGANGLAQVPGTSGTSVGDWGETTVMNGERFVAATDSTGTHWVPAGQQAGDAAAAGSAASSGSSAGASGSVSAGDLASAGLRAAGTGISSGVQGYAAIQQGNADAAALRDQAKMKNYQANLEIENAEVAKRDRMRQFRQLRGQGRAAAAANGMLVEGDNVATWEQDLAGEAAYDSWKIGENARRTAWGYRQEAKTMNRQARQARRTGNLKAAGAWISAPFQMFGAGAPVFA